MGLRLLRYRTAHAAIKRRLIEGAALALEQVIEKYPAGDAVRDAQLKLAECRAHLYKKVSSSP